MNKKRNVMGKSKTGKNNIKLDVFPCIVPHEKTANCDVCKKKEHKFSINRGFDGITEGVVCSKACEIAFILSFDYSKLEEE